jgi:hypothetical protein
LCAAAFLPLVLRLEVRAFRSLAFFTVRGDVFFPLAALALPLADVFFLAVAFPALEWEWLVECAVCATAPPPVTIVPTSRRAATTAMEILA